MTTIDLVSLQRLANAHDCEVVTYMALAAIKATIASAEARADFWEDECGKCDALVSDLDAQLEERRPRWRRWFG